MDPYDFQFRNPQKTLVPQKREPLHSACDYLPYSTNISLRIVDAMWPAIKEFYSDAEPADPKRDIAGKPELTVTRFQGKKSLYVSSLGRPTPNRSLKKEPVKYMIICGYDSRWQLGRVVERINNMGTLRLAAIYDIDRLQKISDKLRDLYGKWRKDPKPDPATFARELDALGSELPLGLAYRIERSAYYVKSFESILADMRSHLLEGFQPYADFVHRRMGGTFEFIYRIGVRYRELRNEVELTLERQRTEDIRGIEGRIRTVTEDLYDKQSTAVDLASMSNRLQNGQTSLLKRAELFLGLGAIVSIGQLVRDMVLDINPSAKGWSYSGYVVAALTVLMILTWLWSREEPVR
jgi:hypothetical protein